MDRRGRRSLQGEIKLPYEKEPFATDFCRKGVDLSITLIPFAPFKCGRRRGSEGRAPQRASLVRFLRAQEMNIYLNLMIISMPVSFTEKKQAKETARGRTIEFFLLTLSPRREWTLRF